MNEDRVLAQLHKMVQAGRITEDEAARLRAAAGTSEFDRVMGEIRARHASSRLEAAVRSGEMTEDEATHHLERIEQGEHPSGLRSRLRQNRKASARSGRGA